MTDLRLVKRNLRKQMVDIRRVAHRDDATAAQKLCDLWCARFSVLPPLVIGLYAAIANEMDTDPLMEKLESLGFDLALPAVIAKDVPLLFRKYKWRDTLCAGVMHTREPLADVPEVVPDLLCLPLLAFDKHGHRLGYGGGYYDRTLSTIAKNNPDYCVVGLAYDVQEVDIVPTGRFDKTLDAVVTPTSIRIFSEKGRQKFSS